MASLHIDRREVILHIIFWITWIICFVFVQSLGKGPDEYFVWTIYYLLTLPVFIAHTYLIAYWLIPSYFFKAKYWLFSVGAVLLLFVFSVIELIVSNELIFRYFDPSKMFGVGYLNLSNIVISGIGNHYIILAFLAIKAGRSWYNSENKKEELLQSKMETELEIYQYQLQPKLILTLIDEMEKLTIKEPDKAPEMIIKISGFLNRFLYEGKEDLIPLQLEVKLLKEFLEIHEHALGERLTNNFVVSGNLKAFVVPPLLLLPFLNNAIKVAYECNNSYESTVIIKAEKKYLLFSFNFWSEESFRLDDEKNVEITKQRLNYRFQGKHRLIENVDDNYREISLEIYL